MWFGVRVGDLNSCVHAQSPPAEPGAAGGHVRRLPSGVTLIELLITIMIISILAAAVLGVAAVAGETAREAKTKTIISRIHTLLMQHYDTYTTRRVKVRQPVLDAINSPTLNASTAQRGRLKAEARLYALREMMLMEIPDRWSDVLLNLVPSTPASGVAADPLYLDAPPVPDVPGDRANRTELAGLYLRTYRRIAGATNKITNNTNTDRDVLANQGAECLYMVVMNACGDGEARTLFPASSIADTDGDGAPEFIDGWGHPIEFLRWAPGFESDAQYNANALVTPEEQANAGGTDHDPFDLYRAHPVAFRLLPLVVSAGRDEELGLLTNVPSPLLPWRTTTGTTVSNLLTDFTSQPPYVIPALDPYVRYPSPVNGYLGTVLDRSVATDNVTNHLISTR
jgi:prepilin-type N-terminal cleavage/methylation domain-containing protein